MATSLAAAYREFIDEAFHLRRPARLERWLTDDYAAVDAFQPARAGGPDGTAAYCAATLAALPVLRYDVVDTLEVDGRLAVRYVAVGVDHGGRRVVVPGMSFHHGHGGKLARSWNVLDLRDLGRHTDADVTPAEAERWRAHAAVTPGPHARTYAAVVDRLYGAPGPTEALIDPEYRAFDPFADLARTAASATALHQRVRDALAGARLEVLDSFEAGDQLATRFLVTGKVDGRPLAVPGLSINHLRGGRLHRADLYCRYGSLLALARTGAEA